MSKQINQFKEGAKVARELADVFDELAEIGEKELKGEEISEEETCLLAGKLMMCISKLQDVSNC